MTIKTKDAITSAYQIIRNQPPWRYDGSSFSHHRVLPYATFSPWLDDHDFSKIMEEVGNHTLVDNYRCHELWSLAKQACVIEGDILEVGVRRGGTGAILASAAPQKNIFLADTFTGVVKAGSRDTRYTGGEHADTSVQLVKKLLADLNINNTTLLQGIFPDETGDLGPQKIALLHCDVDVYKSCRDVVEWAKPRLSHGSIIIFDDYGFFGCEGVTSYCNELRSEPGFTFIHNLNGHGIFIKK